MNPELKIVSNTVILLRGVSGSGKNFTADFIKSLYPKTVIASADDYYTEKYGEYKWNYQEIGAAHEYCRNKFIKALENKVKVIICCNTNATEKQFNFYIETAKEYKYNVISLVVENRADTKNIHNVPEKSLELQAINIRNSLKLR